jgi:subfamily B ATP-binding cassette protein MsbA
LIDGKDIRDVDLKSLRERISWVPQEVMIFNDSAFMNITCGDKQYDKQDVIHAAQAANAHEFIMNLPQGYDTNVGERGTSLSGGQCQRLAIARAFLRDTPILIFDEATSSLDSESEQRIKESMSRLVEGRTSFIIAHRLSTILQADKIVVLKDGRIVDIGRHEQLLQSCELYRRLYQIQFSKQQI